MMVEYMEDGFEWISLYACTWCGADGWDNDLVGRNGCGVCGHSETKFEQNRRPPGCMLAWQEKEIVQ